MQRTWLRYKAKIQIKDNQVFLYIPVATQKKTGPLETQHTPEVCVSVCVFSNPFFTSHLPSLYSAHAHQSYSVDGEVRST